MSALWAVALVLLLSGTAKLRARQDVAETFARLRVPRPFAAPWLARAFPFLELALAAALLQPLTVLRPAVAGAALVLFAAFLALVVRARPDGVSCGCFGEASAAPISGWTVARNVLFLALTALGAVEAVVSLAVRGPAVDWLPAGAFGAGAWAWTLVVALLLAGAAVLVGRESVPAAEAPLAPHPSPAAPADRDDDAARAPVPDVAVGAGPALVGLHDVLREGPVLALRLSPGCGSCSAVLARLPEFQDALGPVRLRTLLPQHLASEPASVHLGALPAEQVLLDPAGRACQALGLHSFPSAVLLGADLLVAGGPVVGVDAVLDMLEEVREIVAAELTDPDDAAGVAPTPVPADPEGRP